MSVVAELEPRAGCPYDVENGRHFRLNDDGTVSYVITYRRNESGCPNTPLYFTGETEEAALAAYRVWCGQRHEAVTRMAARRSRWGPLGEGKM